MINIVNVTKKFDDFIALNNVSLNVASGSIFGLVGSNGAGKSTLLRLISGVYMADGGKVLLDEREVFENINVKNEMIFVSDYPYFFSGATIQSMARYYRAVYKNWDEARYNYLKSTFPIDSNLKISSMSKGMQRQSAIILGLSINPKYILFDEIFDGLDPVIRELVKKILIEYTDETKATVIIASHNLRELENVCDHIGLLHQGGILYENDIDSAKFGLSKVQIVLDNEEDIEKIKSTLDVIKIDNQGKVISFTARNDEKTVLDFIDSLNPSFYEVLPLTLEELFISEMEEVGYDINNFFK